MEAIHNINVMSFYDTLLSLITAFVLGGLVGFERQYRQRTAGLRTNVLVSVGAAMFVDMANRLQGHDGAIHVLGYVVSGIGFLGAGVIMREGGNVRGLNTAATLWGSAAIGACAGADLILEAVCGTVFVLAANTLLRPVVNAINREPLDMASVEVTNTIYIIVHRDNQKEALKLLEDELRRSNHPTHDLTIHAFGEEEVEMEATLAATSVNREELDAVVKRLSASSFITQAFWSPRTNSRE